MAGFRKISFTEWPGSGVPDVVAWFVEKCELLKSDARIVYAVASLEESEGEKKPHIQGFVYYEEKQVFSRLKRCLQDNTVHCEASYGLASENRDYIKHEGKHSEKVGALLAPVFEFGTIPRDSRGRPSESSETGGFSELVDGILAGKTDLELIQEFPSLYVRYFHNISRLREKFYVAPDVRLRLSKES